ncbi:filament-like plant protein 1 [Asbolus verrucosus]|uniref:Filament-like plant protein 1 n=1 Tax=Asbolus verrucosus TaxID=1661398 RepID=A0A482WCP0_ASBVE|nr:filament-like plant protein 1 [Asbolus verrucosus]
MESAFLKLRLIDDRLQMFEGCMELIEKLNQIQQKFNTKELTPEAILLSHAHKLRKHSNYLAKLKICIKMYIHLNEILSKKINDEYELSQKKIDKIVTVTPDEIKIMEKKISRYEHELTKLEVDFNSVMI